MSSEWRDLLYPLGFIASFGFTARFLLQWLISEKEHRSIVTRSFWLISLFSNLLMVLHSFFQVQYPLCMIQMGNALISWRNLNLMQKNQISIKKFIFILFLFFLLTTLLFVLQSILCFDGQFTWMRAPTFLTKDFFIDQFHPFWHLIGFLGVCLFSSRFWVQWWYAEKSQQSFLGKPFWWLSLIGALLSLAYFICLKDIVNMIGPAFGLIPYTRNLILSSKKYPIPREVR